MERFNKTNKELEDVLRAGPLAGSRSADELIELANDQDIVRENGTRSMLMHLIFEYLITRTFNVGKIIIAQIGKTYSDEHGKYVMHYEGDMTRHVGGRDTIYASETEIIAMAKSYDRIFEERCEQTTINFPTGELLFANYFSPMDELPDNIKYGEKFSINGALGRQNTMEWLAENRGIAYGQLGNTSCAVYKVNDDKIYITSAYAEDDDEGNSLIPPGEMMGTISCGVWRFEGVDKADIAKHKFNIEEAEIDDLVEVKVNPGEWEMRVYYQHYGDDDLIEKFKIPLWAELNRVI